MAGARPALVAHGREVWSPPDERATDDRRHVAVRRRRDRPRPALHRRRRRPRRGAAKAGAGRAGPLPRWKRAEILDTAARLLAEREERVRPHHRRRGGQADPHGPGRGRSERSARSSSPPPRPARSPATSCRSTRSPRRGQDRFRPCGSRSASSARSRPFNFPLNLVAHKVAPAIAAGCPVVLKPASQTPFSAIALAELLVDECGLPAEWLHVVTGGGGTVGNALVDHPDIALITFTGSPEVGWGDPGPGAAQAGRPRARQQRPGHHRARQRLATAAAKIRVAGFSHAGQSCISTQRILVHRDIVDDFTRRARRRGVDARRRRPARRGTPTCRR